MVMRIRYQGPQASAASYAAWNAPEIQRQQQNAQDDLAAAGLAERARQFNESQPDAQYKRMRQLMADDPFANALGTGLVSAPIGSYFGQHPGTAIQQQNLALDQQRLAQSANQFNQEMALKNKAIDTEVQRRDAEEANKKKEALQGAITAKRVQQGFEPKAAMDAAASEMAGKSTGLIDPFINELNKGPAAGQPAGLERIAPLLRNYGKQLIDPANAATMTELVKRMSESPEFGGGQAAFSGIEKMLAENFQRLQLGKPTAASGQPAAEAAGGYGFIPNPTREQLGGGIADKLFNTFARPGSVLTTPYGNVQYRRGVGPIDSEYNAAMVDPASVEQIRNVDLPTYAGILNEFLRQKNAATLMQPGVIP